MKNEKGSVLSVAIIVVMLLSFSITTISAYTHNVASRTNTSVQVRDDNMIGDAYLREAMMSFRETLDDWMAPDINSFNDLYLHRNVHDEIDRLEGTYSRLGDTLTVYSNPEGDPVDTLIESHREFIFEYAIGGTDIVLKRSMIATIGESEFEGRDYRSIFDQNNGIVPKYLEDNIDTIPKACIKDDDDYDVDICMIEYENSLDEEAKNKENVLTGDFYIYSEEGVDDDTSKRAGLLDLGGYMLIVDGDFYLNDLDNIKNGVIVITGSLKINRDSNERTFGLELNDVIIFVDGEVNLNFTHTNDQGNLEGSNWAIIGYDNDSQEKFYINDNHYRKNQTNQETSYYIETNISTGYDNDFVHYASDKEADNLDKLIARFSTYFDESTHYVFDYFY